MPHRSAPPVALSRFLASGLLISLAAVLTVAAFRLAPERWGDGYEYYLTLEALQNHGGAGITPSDAGTLENKLRGTAQRGFDLEFVSRLKDDFESGRASHGMYPASNGRFYAYHFWAYALTAWPAAALLEATGASSLKAFQLTNAWLIVAAVGIVLLSLRLAPAESRLLAVLFVTGGALFYWQWPQPEVFSAALLFVACVAMVSGRYAATMLCASFAALQNPTLAILVPATLAYAWLRSRVERAPLGVPRWLRLAAVAAASLAVAALPYAFYLWRFGKPSLITDIGFIDPALLDTARVASFFFDLSQGAIVGLPGVVAGWLLAVALAAVAALRWNGPRLGTEARIAVLDVAALSVAFAILAAPMLMQNHWNSGASIFMRYAFVAGAVLMVAAVRGLTLLPPRAAAAMAAAMAAMQIAVTAIYYPHAGSMGDYLAPKPLAAAVLARAPALYDPEPEIFIERTLRREVAWTRDGIRAAAAKLPHLMAADGSDVAKVLVSLPLAADTFEPLCGPKGVLAHRADGRPVGQADFSRARHDTGYLSGRFHCRFRHGAARHGFSSDAPSLGWTLAGFSAREPWGVWSDGAAASARLSFLSAPPAGLELTIVAHGFVPRWREPIRVSVTANGMPVADFVLAGAEPEDHRLRVPRTAFASTTTLTLGFAFANPIDPAELAGRGLPSDGRRLAMGLREIRIDPP